MLAGIDIETQGLNATKYLTGCLITEQKKKPEIYRNKKALWKKVVELGIKEAKRNRVLNIYSHNASFDTAGYIDLNDKHLVFFCNKPFIWAYRITKQEADALGIRINGQSKEIIKFLDTLSIYRMKLKKVGELVGLEKMNTPEELLEEQTKGKLTKKQMEEIETYMVRDTQIVLKAINKMKEKLKSDGVNIKRLYTINQIAIQYIITKLKKLPRKITEGILRDPEKGITWYGSEYKTSKQEEFMQDIFNNIHSAYRGGRVEAFKTGIFKGKVTYIDKNSEYPASITQMEIPDLRTEKKVWKPLMREISIERKILLMKKLLSKIGVSRVLIKNKSNKLGLIPIRTKSGNYYPKTNKYIIGTYTHLELREAIKEGYILLDIEWSITWDKLKVNPFKIVYEDLFNKRMNRKGFDYNFYKSIMNNSIGKMGQTRTNQEIVIDSVEKAEEYLKKNYEVIKGVKKNYMYKGEPKNYSRKPYYMPIISALVTAHARINMYKEMKKVPLENLLYTDTDSIITYGDYTKLYDINPNKLGAFKIEAKNEDAVIFGRKTYRVGKEIKIAGFRQRNITTEDFDKGYVSTKQMITINTCKELKDVGLFTDVNRDLNEQKVLHDERTKILGEIPLYIDSDINNISFFMPKIREIAKNF